MKKLLVTLLVLVACLQNIGLQVSKASSTDPSLPSIASPVDVDVVPDEVADSQLFFDGAVNARGKTPDYAAKVEALLARMTLEEKVGQMTQLEIGMICDGQGRNIKVNPAKLEKAVIQYGAGSILNVAGEALSIDKWHEIIGQIQETAKRSRLKIPVIYGIDTI